MHVKLKIDTLNINILNILNVLNLKEASYKGWVYAKLNGATVPSRPLLNLPYQTQRWLRSGNVGSFESRFYDFTQKDVFSISTIIINNCPDSTKTFDSFEFGCKSKCTRIWY